MSDIRMRGVDEREIDTVLAPDIEFSGELQFSDPLMIKGNFKGEIKATGDLYIMDKSLVEARIQAANISLYGHLKGNIVSGGRVELARSAKVEGDITTPDLLIERGAKFNGICTMPDKENQ
jgi:cytoskeletal protein CcmA (bactofilin family)